MFATPRSNFDETPYHIYYDTNITNNDVTGLNPLRLSFSETRSGGALITNPNDYFFSIVRFEVQTPNLPVFIPQIMLNQTNSVNKTIYRLQFVYYGQSFGDFIYYEPTDTTITPPSLPLTQADLVHPYYYIHTFSDWVALLNSNIQRILLNWEVPYSLDYKFSYNTSTGLLSFATPVQYKEKAMSPYATIGWNGALHTLLSSFEVHKIDDPQACYRLNLRYGPEQYYNSPELMPTEDTKITFTSTQNYPSLAMCTPIESIVFTSTGNLPVVPSNSGPLKVSNNYNTSDGTRSGINSLSSVIVPLLTDFIVPLNLGWEYKPYILYEPSVYRLMDMNSNSSLNHIDIQVFWKSNLTGVLVPIYLDSQCSASMKIMFRRKKFNVDI